MARGGAAPEPSPMIDVRSVSFRFGSGDDGVLALDHVSLQCTPGEFVAVVGPSGCGKSTLLSLVAGLRRPVEGEVWVNRTHVTGPPPDLGIIFQKDTLFPWRTVIENVELGLEIRGDDLPNRRRKAAELLERYGLAGFERKYPHTLSGGMRKRVQLMQVLAVDPEILLLDEAFGALDAQTRVKVEDEFVRIQRTTGKTVLMVTHDITEAIAVADRVVVLSARPGRVKITLPIRFPHRPSVGEVTSLPRFNDYYMEVWRNIEDTGTRL